MPVYAICGYVGIDVAKASLEVAYLDAQGRWQSGHFGNDQTGFGRLQRWLHKRSPASPPASLHICLEATGRYSWPLAVFLVEQGYGVSVVNPARPQHYRQALGWQTKTDKHDAKLLAHFCATQQPEPWQPPSEGQRQLQELTRHLDMLKQAHTRTHNRLEASPSSEWVRQDLAEELARLKQRIAALEQEIAAVTQADADQRQQMALLTSIPGIGCITAARFLAEVPDVRRFDHADQLAAYAGLVPKQHDSGSSVHRKATLTKTGNPHLRHAFYMPALSAARFNPLARQLADRLTAAGNKLAERLEGRKGNFGTNLPVGTLRFFMHHADDTLREYRRSLDLDTAIAQVRYRIDGATYRRDLFASHVDGVLVVHIACDQPGRVGLRIALDGDEQPYHTYTEAGGVLCMDVQAREPIHSDGLCGVEGHVRLQVLHQGGTLTTHGSQISVSGSDALTLVVAFASSFDESNPGERCRARLAAATGIPYADLKQRHIQDHRSLFRRVALDLGASPAATLPIDQRIAAVQQGEADPALVALLFQFGRYLLIAGSRPGSPLPAHLQGVWNDNVACRIGWTCDYHLDINTQMNYWIAETTHLSECHQPLLRWIADDLAPAGRQTARALYGLPGWVAHIFSNAWGYTAVGWSIWWGVHPTGGVWIATHLWEHYLFSGDRAFLANVAYPVLKEAAEFFLAYLFEDPATGWLLSGPSNSPENVYLYEGKPYRVCLAPTADRILIHELFSACIAAGRDLAVDEALVARLVAARAKLPPFQIGKHGQLQEWLADYDEALPHHRHTTHLLGVFPFAQVTPDETPELAAAAQVSIARRENAPPAGYEEGSWGRNLITLYHARLGDGAAAHASLQTLFVREGERSLMMGTKLAPRNAYELDYNTGVTAAIAEMLLQSHRGYLHLLPALPTQWPIGHVRGLTGRGGFVVDLTWEDGRLTTATIDARREAPCRIRSTTPLSVSWNGQPVAASQIAPDTLEFAAAAGQVYTLAHR